MVISINVTVDAYLELQKQAFKLKFVEIGKMAKLNQILKKKYSFVNTFPFIEKFKPFCNFVI